MPFEDDDVVNRDGQISLGRLERIAARGAGPIVYPGEGNSYQSPTGQTFTQIDASQSGKPLVAMVKVGGISNVTNTTTPTVTTTVPHGLSAGQSVTIAGVAGATGANGTFVVGATPDALNFNLPGSPPGAYTSGGMVQTGEGNYYLAKIVQWSGTAWIDPPGGTQACRFLPANGEAPTVGIVYESLDVRTDPASNLEVYSDNFGASGGGATTSPGTTNNWYSTNYYYGSSTYYGPTTYNNTTYYTGPTVSYCYVIWPPVRVTLTPNGSRITLVPIGQPPVPTISLANDFSPEVCGAWFILSLPGGSTLSTIPTGNTDAGQKFVLLTGWTAIIGAGAILVTPGTPIPPSGTGAVDGTWLILTNESSGVIAISQLDNASNFANQFNWSSDALNGGSRLYLYSEDSASFLYDAQQQKWVLQSTTGQFSHTAGSVHATSPAADGPSAWIPVGFTRQTFTANYTISGALDVMASLVNSAANVTATLPKASSRKGQLVYVCDEGGGLSSVVPLTIAPAVGDSIFGPGGTAIYRPYGLICYESDGSTGWYTKREQVFGAKYAGLVPQAGATPTATNYLAETGAWLPLPTGYTGTLPRVVSVACVAGVLTVVTQTDTYLRGALISSV